MHNLFIFEKIFFLRTNLYKNYMDIFGIGTSVVCALHCAILPFFLSSIPFWNLLMSESIWLEIFIICSSLIFGLMAFYKGCFVQHKKKVPVVLFSIGFTLLLINLVVANLVLVFIPAASILIISGHLLNFKFCRQHKNCKLH